MAQRQRFRDSKGRFAKPENAVTVETFDTTTGKTIERPTPAKRNWLVTFRFTPPSPPFLPFTRQQTYLNMTAAERDAAIDSYIASVEADGNFLDSIEIQEL